MEMKKITLNTRQPKFNNIDEELLAYAEFERTHSFGITMKKLLESVKDLLPRYDMGLGCTVNELEELAAAYEYGFNCNEIQFEHLLREIGGYLADYDIIVRFKNGRADAHNSNHADVATHYNSLLDIATA